jgi:hypothetical protein
MIQPILPALGPYPMYDVFGITAAVAMLAKSLEPGRYQPHTQFETIRKLRSAYSNLYLASSTGSTSMTVLGRESAKPFLSNCPTNSKWFEKFAKGCLHQMGQEIRQDLAISIKVMLALMGRLEEEWIRVDRSRQETLIFCRGLLFHSIWRIVEGR